jgi:catechol 2,3-dioxygenase-like lactoylglutathione lyase family enzyme
MSRLQLAINVNDLDESVAFYSRLFDTEPAKRRPGYANFAVAQPPLKLVLIENPGKGGSLNHLGLEVSDTDAVNGEQARLAVHGFATTDERESTCCYAKQDKFWVENTPNGEQWEIYTVLADSQTFSAVPEAMRWDAAAVRKRPALKRSPVAAADLEGNCPDVGSETVVTHRHLIRDGSSGQSGNEVRRRSSGSDSPRSVSLSASEQTRSI